MNDDLKVARRSISSLCLRSANACACAQKSWSFVLRASSISFSFAIYLFSSIFIVSLCWCTFAFALASSSLSFFTVVRTISFHSASLMPVPLFTVIDMTIRPISSYSARFLASSSFCWARLLRLLRTEWLPDELRIFEEALLPRSLSLSKNLLIALCEDAAVLEIAQPCFTFLLKSSTT